MFPVFDFLDTFITRLSTTKQSDWADSGSDANWMKRVGDAMISNLRGQLPSQLSPNQIRRPVPRAQEMAPQSHCWRSTGRQNTQFSTLYRALPSGQIVPAPRSVWPRCRLRATTLPGSRCNYTPDSTAALRATGEPRFLQSPKYRICILLEHLLNINIECQQDGNTELQFSVFTSCLKGGLP